MQQKTNTSLLYFVVLVILLSIGLAFFLRSSAFTVESVKIEGLTNINSDEFTKLTQNIKGQNLFLLDKEDVSQKIFLNPLVQNVSMNREFPHTLVIKVEERKPAALIVVTNGVIEVDNQGVFLRRLESWPNTDYPVITGVDLPDTAGPGQKLDNPLMDASLNLLGQAPVKLLPLIGELHVNPIKQITIFLTSGVEVRLGQSNDWKVKLNSLLQLLNNKDYQSFQQGVRYIDFTAAKPVIGR